MKAGSIDAAFNMDKGEIHFPIYPFPATAPRHIAVSDIVEVIDWFPPALRLKDDELLLVSRGQLDELTIFCERHNIEFVRRYDAWSDLLEPFLDTELTFSARKGIYARLTKAGFSKEEVRAIRKKVSRRMWQWTYATWEWQHYGLYDFWEATKPRWFQNARKWRNLYSWSMEIAIRGIEGDQQEESV